ncbi:MAG: hypothetical protein ACFWUE_11340 [Xylanivirga thermophila]|uniref:hypothetical protein n=1 Tax=Xylanivirga thermophila TaxID=2496273 RepID=UPI00101BA1F5|nr:hypothetical protein [Xylanivirga thermophila]
MSKFNNKTFNKSKHKWILQISITTILLSYIFSMFSENIVAKFNLLWALLSILFIIAIGVIFDLIGVAVTFASEVPFISMASKKIKGASQSLWLIRNADHVSSICNDVVGDVCGIVSGSAGGILVLRLIDLYTGLDQVFLSILVSSCIAALTVASKAVAKSFAMKNNQKIVYYVGYFISFFIKKEKNKSDTRNHKERVRMF